MKQKRNKKIFFLLVLLPVFLFKIVLTAYDSFLGDSDGKITTFWVNQLFSTFNLFVLLTAIYLFLKNNLKVSKRIIRINFFVFLLICYAFNSFLKGRDSYLSDNIVDTNYYYTNYNKYFNVTPRPPDRYTWGNKYELNSEGFRQKKIFNNKKKPIIFIGDSFTWGAGLSDKERYTNKIQSALNKKDSNYVVINLGLPGACATEIKNVLEKHISVIKPVLVIYGFCSNDVLCRKESWSIESERKNKTWKTFLKQTQIAFSTIKLNHFGELLIKSFNTLLDKVYGTPRLENGIGRFYKKNSKEWEIFEKNLRAIYKTSMTKTTNRPILAVFTQKGWFSTTDKKEQSLEINKRKTLLKQVAVKGKEIGFNVIDFNEVLEELMRNDNFDFTSKMQVSPLDGHPSKYLNKIFAEGIFPEVYKIVIKDSIYVDL